MTNVNKEKNKKIRNNHKNTNSHIELLYGRHVVLDYLREGGSVNKLFIQKDLQNSQLDIIFNLVKEHSLVFSEVPKAKLDDLTQGANHQGLAVTIPPIAYQSLEDCLALAERRQEAPFLVILDGIEDPHNLGSIIRTAEAAGVHGVIIPKRRATGLTGIVAKTSAGSIRRVPVVRVTNISRTIQELKQAGLWIFASDMTGEDMRQWNSQGPIALVIGNEGRGVSTKVRQHCDGVVTIPMQGQVESLNASVAAGLLMYEVARRRLP